MPTHAERHKTGQRPGRPLLARLTGSVFGKEREVPTEFRIFAAGANGSEKGTFHFTDKSALSVMAEFVAHAKPMLLDYNHGTTFDSPTPDQAIAAGEFTPEIRNGELWATNIRWTDRAKTMLSAGEYRLFSPFFTHDKEGQVLRLVNVALTNLPALDGIAPLVAANANTDDEESPMECTACTALNAQLSAMKTECDALKAKCSAFETEKPEAEKATALRSDVAKLTGAADVPTAIGVISAWKASHDKVASLTAEVAATKTASREAEFTTALDKAVTDALITPAQKKEFWEVQCKADGKVTEAGLAMLNAFMKTAKPVISKEPVKQGNGAVALTEQQAHIAKLCGVPLTEREKFETERLSAGR